MNDLNRCEPEDISLKTFFLGPQAENSDWVMATVQQLFEHWFQWRRNYSPTDGDAITPQNRLDPAFLKKQKQLSDHLQVIMRRFEDEVPKFTPRYVGHMLSEQSLPALLGHIITLLHNPNNISGEASRVGIQIEREAIEDLCAMVGWEKKRAIGHFTSGGTVANFEGLLRAKNRLYQWLALGTFLKEKNLIDRSLFDLAHMGWREFDRLMDSIDVDSFYRWKNHWLANPIRFSQHVSSVFQVEFEGPILLVSQSKHYSWPKGTELLGMGSDRLWPVNLNEDGRMDVEELKNLVNKCRSKNIPICGVVSVAGTTELGTVDPIASICEYLDVLEMQGVHLWHHIDAAYGGFLCSMIGMPLDSEFAELIKNLESMKNSNSITIDPHKLGYVPYASGVILVKNRREYAFQDIQAPYIQFDGKNDVGLQTLEGSRSAAGAVATWLTERSIGLNADGYGRILARTIKVKNLVERKFKEKNANFCFPNGLDTNVLCMTVAKRGESLLDANNRIKAIYAKMAPGQKSSFIISKTTLSFKNYRRPLQYLVETHSLESNAQEVELLRLCLMNPFIVSKETNIFYPEALVDEIIKYF